MIEIQWQDGHDSVFDFDFLRRNCPCALCAGEAGIPGTVDEHTVFASEQTALAEMRPVGNYGMSLTWQDGHAEGIYSFEMLRAACLCRECDTRRRAERHTHD